MRLRTYLTPVAAGFIAAGSLTLATDFTSSAGAVGATSSCGSLTKAVVSSDGFTSAAKPTVRAYNYAMTSANPANALGTTIDFGAKALVVSCVSPADIKRLSAAAQGASKPTMSAAQYMAYLVKQSSGAMNRTTVGGVNDYLDQGSGKEDGLGSTSKAPSVRLDAWIAGNYIVLTQTVPAAASPSKPLLALIKSSKRLL